MADLRLPQLANFNNPASGDMFYAVDISDTGMSAAGTSKNITFYDLLNNQPVSNISGLYATITGLQSGKLDATISSPTSGQMLTYYTGAGFSGWQNTNFDSTMFATLQRARYFALTL